MPPWAWSGAADDAADGALDGATSDVGASANSSATDATVTSDAGTANTGASDPSTNDPTGDTSASNGDGPNCQNSFTGDTKVLLGSGRRVAIDKLRLGQRVRAADPYTGTVGARRIVRVITHTRLHAMVAITLIGGAVIHATAHHQLWDASAGRFAYANALKAGDKLAEPGGRLIAVSKSRDYRAYLTAYNLSIYEIHTYYVYAGHLAVLVHNCPPGNTPASGGSGGKVWSSPDEPETADSANAIEGQWPGRITAVNDEVPMISGPNAGLTREVDVNIGPDLFIQAKGGTGRHIIGQIIDTIDTTGVPTIGYAPGVRL